MARNHFGDRTLKKVNFQLIVEEKEEDLFLGRKPRIAIPEDTLKSTKRILEKYFLSLDSRNIKFLRQLSQFSTVVAERIGLGVPSGYSLKFKGKDFEFLVLTLYITQFHPYFFESFRIDNEKRLRKIFKQVSVTTPIKDIELKRREKYYLYLLSRLAILGPRKVGGILGSTQVFDGFRIRFDNPYPKKPKAKQFHRGYRDHGSVAPLSKKVKQAVQRDYNSLLESLAQKLEKLLFNHIHLTLSLGEPSGPILYRLTSNEIDLNSTFIEHYPKVIKIFDANLSEIASVLETNSIPIKGFVNFWNQRTEVAE